MPRAWLRSPWSGTAATCTATSACRAVCIIAWFHSVGVDLTQGLINAIKSMLGPLESVVSEGANLAKDAWGFITGSHSPSREIHIRGVGFVDGLPAAARADAGGRGAAVRRAAAA